MYATATAKRATGLCLILQYQALKSSIVDSPLYVGLMQPNKNGKPKSGQLTPFYFTRPSSVNVSKIPIMAMGGRQCLSLSVVQLKCKQY